MSVFCQIREYLLIVAMNEEPHVVLDTDDILEERAAAIFRAFDSDRDGVMSLANLIEMSTFVHKVIASLSKQKPKV